MSNDVPTDQSTEPCEIEPTPTTSTQYDLAQPSSNPKRNKYLLHETDKHSRPLESHKSNDAVKSFLNSLVPELRVMNLHQFKMFKRRVISLIDDILNPPPTTIESAATIQ